MSSTRVPAGPNFASPRNHWRSQQQQRCPQFFVNHLKCSDRPRRKFAAPPSIWASSLMVFSPPGRLPIVIRARFWSVEVKDRCFHPFDGALASPRVLLRSSLVAAWLWVKLVSWISPMSSGSNAGLSKSVTVFAEGVRIEGISAMASSQYGRKTNPYRRMRDALEVKGMSQSASVRDNPSTIDPN